MQINQVFSNLIANAINYLDPARTGKIKISGYRNSEHSVYCVEDNGVGMPQEYHKKIFEIFHRLNPKSTQGEGIGLTIVSKILERHMGKIWVESNEGEGSRFYVALPLQVDTDER